MSSPNSTEDLPVVGFAGLGAMGAPMARNLLAAGYRLRVWNRTAAKADALVTAGATLASSVSELGSTCDVVVTMVSDGPDLEAVALGADGLLATPRKGLLWIDCSSVAPGVTTALAEQARALGVEPLDAPVSGGTRGAEDGTLSIMVGGAEAAFARALPLLGVVGGRVTHVGEAGAGQVAKLVNQIIVGGTIALVAEGLTLAEALGCSPAQVRDALAGGFADSRVLQVHGERMLTGDFAPGFLAELQLKDLRNALAAGADSGASLPVAAVVHELYKALTATGGGALDHAGLATLTRRLSGLEEVHA